MQKHNEENKLYQEQASSYQSKKTLTPSPYSLTLNCSKAYVVVLNNHILTACLKTNVHVIVFSVDGVSKVYPGLEGTKLHTDPLVEHLILGLQDHNLICFIFCPLI